MNLVIVLWVALTQQFYAAAPQSQDTCHEEAKAVLQSMQKQFPDQEFKAACVSDKFLRKGQDA